MKKKLKIKVKKVIRKPRPSKKSEKKVLNHKIVHKVLNHKIVRRVFHKLVSHKLKKSLSKPLKFSRPILIILGIVFFILILFLVLNFILLIFVNTQTKKDLSALKNQTEKKIEAVTDPITKPASSTIPANAESFNSFGDHFSGLSFIDEKKSNLNWDYNVSAFTFPPLYNFEKVERGLNGINSVASRNIITAYRLKVSNNELYYQGRKLKLPSELSGQNILKMTVSLNGSRWLIGIVTGKNYDERGWVYFYDPVKQSFLPLITETTAEKIEPKFERLGGIISFGGTADNFLIVYGGYDGHVLYYYHGALTDVSQFFGLRVSAGGFTPQIISRDNSRGTVFYICSETDGKPKLIKFWPKQAGELMGSLDFTPQIFTENLGAASASCELEEAGTFNLESKIKSPAKILIDIKKANNTLETWRFIDNGFDNSLDREVSSYDIGKNSGHKIKRAIIADMGISAENNSTDTAINNQFSEVFLANKLNAENGSLNWQKIKIKEWFEFNEPTGSLFWRETFKAIPNDPDYSPWFDHINQLNYITI